MKFAAQVAKAQRAARNRRPLALPSYLCIQYVLLNTIRLALSSPHLTRLDLMHPWMMDGVAVSRTVRCGTGSDWRFHPQSAPSYYHITSLWTEHHC